VARVVAANGTASPSHQLRGPALMLVVLGAAVLAANMAIVLFGTSTTKVTEIGGAQPNKETTTVAPFSESVSSTLLGAGVLLVLAGAFFSRVSKITGPGDVAVEFSPDEKGAAAEAVAARVKNNDPEVSQMAKSGAAVDPEKADEATEGLAQTASRATLGCLESARVLLKLARTAPDEALALAREWQIPPAVAEATILSGETSTELWAALADRVVGGT
jgi:hypothetical protein